MVEPQAEPRTFIPLPYLEFQVLVSLADADLHGYAIVKEIAARSPDGTTPSTGSLYLAIGRLLQAGLIAELDDAATPQGGRKRRVYRLTDTGRAVARAEAERLGELSRLAGERLQHGRSQASSPSQARG